ncbi:uncharacterized protein N7483_005268 [Penicillium malachiteum]|uniref:uncharacterized protein n=1 Tax=Penicillium malachiteum TaxID=1324776 RepID=UPI002546DFC2|nr:uncharacterized protein N7483_005268 [Penicillium malachiteum]KAJ5730760.1 hypothetical protein N7483_005268 [Penicillium malachiteum]
MTRFWSRWRPQRNDRNQESPLRHHRRDLARETQNLTPNIIVQTEASDESILYQHLLAPIQPNLTTSSSSPRITVQNADSFTAAQRILNAHPTAKVGVLNMASEKHPGGGWLHGALAQEEALCFRSTLAATLNDSHYPLPEFGAIWSPRVAVFRDEVARWCRIYPHDDIFIVGVVSLAALRNPRLSKDKQQFANLGDIRVTKDKMRQVLRVLAQNNVTHCVLGALGCGAFHNPPREVARISGEVLSESEWRGKFEEIVFAVLDTRNEGNFRIFNEALGA